MSAHARDILATVDTVAGYSTYIDLIRPLIGNRPVIATGMTKEVERVSAAVETALSGKACAIVCSGDPGIYAMAGLAFELCRERGVLLMPPDGAGAAADGGPRLRIEVVPGIPALCAGAALLGAPLTHDFAVVSLSDLLTPWEVIENRLRAAARADFVIVIYNPKSKRRGGHLEKARDIILEFRNPRTPVGIVRRAMRAGQQVEMVALEDLHRAEVDMQTIVFVGSSASFVYLDYMVTPRGYAAKYRLVGGLR